MRPPRRRSLSWLEDIPRRVALDAAAREAYPDLRFHRKQRRGGPVFIYEVTLDVPGYEPRRVRVEFRVSSPRFPRVYADGPQASPHRYGGAWLCIWYPSDGDDQRWVPEDGLLALLGMAAVHLFKEAYWRETGEWLGEEAPHGQEPKDPEDEPQTPAEPNQRLA
jgi:hypothetical protein